MIEKIVSLAEAERLLAEARRRGRQIVMANGCFDFVHVGHIRYLQGSKSEGDLLLVAVNSDSSVRALKGKGRPILPEAERAEIVAAIGCVDLVVVFDDLTVDSLLIQLRPDVHAKGTDYTEATVPERETVLSYGGRVAIVGDPKDRSSKDYIARLKGK
jgi:rfaE bifunctional protein nucleotidyltransferase chain/domain